MMTKGTDLYSERTGESVWLESRFEFDVERQELRNTLTEVEINLGGIYSHPWSPRLRCYILAHAPGAHIKITW